jgi:hypothetical protein
MASGVQAWRASIGSAPALKMPTQSNTLTGIATRQTKQIDRMVSPSPELSAPSAKLEHDPEKWKPVFRKDHAPPKCWLSDPPPMVLRIILDN